VISAQWRWLAVRRAMIFPRNSAWSVSGGEEDLALFFFFGFPEFRIRCSFSRIADLKFSKSPTSLTEVFCRRLCVWQLNDAKCSCCCASTIDNGRDVHCPSWLGVEG